MRLRREAVNMVKAGLSSSRRRRAAGHHGSRRRFIASPAAVTAPTQAPWSLTAAAISMARRIAEDLELHRRLRRGLRIDGHRVCSERALQLFQLEALRPDRRHAAKVRSGAAFSAHPRTRGEPPQSSGAGGEPPGWAIWSNGPGRLLYPDEVWNVEL